jgi:hypothetical protein
VPSADKVIITVVWDEKGVPVVNAFVKGQQWTVCAAMKQQEVWMLVFVLSVCHRKKNVRSVGTYDTPGHAPVCTLLRSLHNLDSVATPMQQCWPHTIRLPPVWSFSVQHAEWPLQEWQSSASIVWWPDGLYRIAEQLFSFTVFRPICPVITAVSGQVMKLITLHYLVLRLRISGAIPLLPLYAFMTCSGRTVTLTLYL